MWYLLLHPSIYSLKSNNLWERVKNAYLNYDDTTLMLLKNLKVNKRKDLNIADLKNDIFFTTKWDNMHEKKISLLFRKTTFLSSEWVESYNKRDKYKNKKITSWRKTNFWKACLNYMKTFILKGAS